MNTAAPVTQTTAPQYIAQRIRELASIGLKVRDISSLLHVHPLLVQLLLDEEEGLLCHPSICTTTSHTVDQTAGQASADRP